MTTGRINQVTAFGWWAVGSRARLTRAARSFKTIQDCSARGRRVPNGNGTGRRWRPDTSSPADGHGGSFALQVLRFSCSPLFTSTDLCAETFRARNHQKIRSTCESGHLGPLGHPSLFDASPGRKDLPRKAHACSGSSCVPVRGLVPTIKHRSREEPAGRRTLVNPPNTRINTPYACALLTLSHRPPLHI